MVTSREQALNIAGQVKSALEGIYGPRLRGVYLYGSAAKDKLTKDSDVDLAIILDKISNRFTEYERTSQLGSQVSLEYNTLVSFFFACDNDFKTGRFSIHRAIKQEGIRA